MNVSLTTRIPQNDDSVSMLMARSLAASFTGSGLASAARTATTSTTSQAPSGFSTVTAILNITVPGAAGGLTMSIQAQDPNGNWLTVAQDVAARTTAFVAGLQVSRYATQSGVAAIPGNPAINGRCWDINGFSAIRATVAHSTADSYTYSVTLTFS